MLTDVGLSPVVKGTWVAKVGALAFVAVVLSRMEAVSLTAFAVAKSGLPSPLKSPMLTERGPVPVEKGTWVAKVGVLAPVVVVLSRMEALSGLKFAVAKSSLHVVVEVADADGERLSVRREGDVGGESGGGGSGGGEVEQDGGAAAVQVRHS
jgi:hypothetical protein